MKTALLVITAGGFFVNGAKSGSADLQGQLYEDLLYDYNKIPRPVKNSTDILTVDVGASLIRIIDVVSFKGNIGRFSAAGDPDITIFTDALVAYDGRVFWQPPAIYKSFCPIDVTWFPYDSQSCEMKFGAWSYTGYYVDLKQLPKDQVVNGTDKYGQDVETMEMGMDLSFFYRVLFMTRPEPKQKTDQTTNTLIDATSLVGVGFSPSSYAVRSSVIPNPREGSPSGKDSSSNSFLCRPSTSKCEKAIPAIKTYSQRPSKTFETWTDKYKQHSGKQNTEPKVTSNFDRFGRGADQSRGARRRIHDVIFLNLLQQVRFIAEHFQRREDEAEISDDWTFVAMVLDRLFLIIFSVLNVGTFLILLEAPSLYDTREPMNITVASKPLGQANVLGGHSRF
uniref:Neurotransmitter-gated ion-channel ligand-binding domain-containing protein n=1 Tax=Parascaris univalens TaxID=6257 RepID=A0A915CAJ8_PARUN